ncbi:NADP/FAD dependent oxidoreductase [Aspergillus steynii IBT 23096]|uniref:NADPH--cytochrome P450 reductase n=1 Tax=Aspergillus steynii IBT 23096 TaxID=1392250 RepID=A0A2I2G2E8_9EURO|nr:NADP/FAD dependent oxidoreductase [Aspergillus steynii IBT 23096]PLB47054.1 NADP/FAD dependent oxidoreductase [Aspergillus steynii IBT 23096]
MSMSILPLSQWRIPPELLQDLSKVMTPTGVADYVALTVLSMAGATYLSRGLLWDQPDPYAHLAFERPQLKHGAGAGSGSKETRNIAQKLAETEKDLVVFWGSQSGTAEGFANRLAREITLRFGVGALSADLSDFDPESVAQIPDSKVVVFVLSTYGEGDPSDNTAEFWDWVNKATKEQVTLQNLRYFAFGLGNSNYKYYNRVVDVVVESLDRLGAKSLMPVGRANDAEGATQEDFIGWKESLFSEFSHQLGFEEKEVQYVPTLAVQEDESLEPIDLHHGEPDNRDSSRITAQCSPVRPLDIATSRQLFEVSDKQQQQQRHCLHIDLDLTSHPELSYKTGDHLAIWPGNPDDEVARLLQVLGRSARRDAPISIQSVDPATKVKIPSPTSAAALFRYYLEICAPVNRDNVLGLAQFAPTPAAKSYLLELGQDKARYAAFLNRTHVNLGRLLQLASPDAPWSELPLSYLVETLPPTQPRYYSISSSSVISPRKASITVLVSSTPVPEAPDQLIHGVTSNYLLAISETLHSSSSHPQGLTYHLTGPNDALTGGKVFAHLRKSRFKLPRLGSCPLIMVAAGTGIAPFRAFIAERRQLQQIGREIGEMILFFGCRHPDEDFLYCDELDSLQTALEGKLRIVTAFSRLGGATPKRYVQDRVQEVGGEVVRLMDEGANFYICGRAGMAREVDAVVGGVMKNAKGWEEEQVNEWRRGIKRRNKWQEDVWG